MDTPDPDDLQLLTDVEGIEFYKDGNIVVLSSESLRSGEDAVWIAYDSLVNTTVELQDDYREESDDE